MTELFLQPGPNDGDRKRPGRGAHLAVLLFAGGHALDERVGFGRRIR